MSKRSNWMLGAAVALGALVGVSLNDFGLSAIDWLGIRPLTVLVGCVALTVATVLAAIYVKRIRSLLGN